ncbi:sce7726 family protein [Glutamicibacter sp. M10]|uniref:sce7726 family protein n=1 Tax=Glutamicibacter sp. M10 TaxID=3023076 RepID=UPI0021C6909D|nr:sce7726 family protein [Glutamicibacter sp. M10]UXN30999.1 sce7726 family protein [Glutamicibacter sp. M10]
MTSDIDIRLALDSQLQGKHGQNPDVLIRHELGVDMGNRRIDLAVLNGHLAGWEIKSDKDTLKRLPEQAEAFSRVMDYLTIVTTSKHLDKCAAIVPPHWGIQEAISGPGGIRIVTRRAPKINRQTDPFSMAQLLWRDEALDELKLRGQARGLSAKPRYTIWQRLSEVVPKKNCALLS